MLILFCSFNLDLCTNILSLKTFEFANNNKTINVHQNHFCNWLKIELNSMELKIKLKSCKTTTYVSKNQNSSSLKL